MKIKDITIKNFRLLEDVSLNIEEDITLIVGKNNTGKTSLFEVINMFFNEKNNFSFHDFSQKTYSQFEASFNIYEAAQKETDEEKKDELEKSLISSMPNIQIEIQIEYDKAKDSLINLSEFISDLDDSKNIAILKLQYRSKDSLRLFAAFNVRKEKEQKLIEWLNENITSYYDIKCFGGDNLIEENFKRKLLSVLYFETIQASRKLDDTKADKNKTLAVGFSDYYRETNKDNNDDVESLEKQLKETSTVLNEKYENILKELLEKLKLFGVEPHLTIPEIVLQAGFDPENILKNNIKYFYKQNDVILPENFNGLGYSNLIYLVLKVVSFIEKFKKAAPLNKSETLTILIEEPEAHLHPQMQQVFISQIKRTIKETKEKEGILVQIIISTHSSHIVTEAGIDVERSFERIRYFAKQFIKGENRYKIEIKDFNEFKHKESDRETFRFLKQYMSLHRCDIFFADKVILVEGPTERIILPLMINKVAENLNNEYVSIIEVGGAYTVKFKELLKFVNTKSLVITDIDSVNPEDSRRTCPTNTPNAKTSNSTLINWVPKKRLINDLNTCPEKDKFDTELIRVAYQIKEDDSEYVARSLEEAIINKNKTFFSSTYKLGEVDKLVKDSFTLLKDEDLNKSPYELAPASGEKTDFTFDLMTFNEKESKLNWNVPKYIEEGLVWLVKNEIVE
ncbi:AAA family ATPase [uncultured Draconibacterium sp.]|uniref:ATP-dependent nuclease n=1 Tax=uncultured Draconibacterium sp. TaxID=1573823 RepID=UPI003216426F